MNSQHVAAQMFLRAWPFPRGTGWLVKRFFEHLTFRDVFTTVRTTDGFSMSIMPNEHIGRYLYLTGEFDRSTFEVLSRHARPGDTLLDIGANVGYMSACFLANIPHSKVIAVEPQPDVVGLLGKNLDQFRGRANIAPVALSDTDGEGLLEVDNVNRGASKLVSEASGNAVKIETWSPERLIAAFQPQRIDIIKIDVEGYEEKVIAALAGSIARYRPRLIMFEDHGTRAAPDGSIGARLHDLGYEIFGVRKKLTVLEYPEIRSAADCRYNDYIAVPRG